MTIALSVPNQLSAVERDDVRALAAAIEADDRQPPLSDQALTALGSDSVEHVLAHDGGELAGYAQLSGSSLEIASSVPAVAPLLEHFAGRALLVWSHGTHSRLEPALIEHGFTRERELHQLRRPLGDEPEELPVPAGVEIRPFVVGRDEDAWLRVNAAAFATHPEQGSWTRTDIEAREAEDWFDPSGFLLAWRAETLAGFHWTKIHPGPVGEVYVIGVDPSVQGSGLGNVLLQRGLTYLRSRGCDQVLLYVDDDNTTAVGLYERTGFHRFDLDVQWSRPAD